MWLLLPVLVVTGCGPSSTFSRDTSAGCMRLHGGRVANAAKGLDTIARGANASAFRVRAGTDAATVEFARTSQDAESLEAAYARALKVAREPTKYLLYRNRNAVVIWAHVPGDDSRATVIDCLVSR